jgi:hypothetical protein
VVKYLEKPHTSSFLSKEGVLQKLKEEKQQIQQKNFL